MNSDQLLLNLRMPWDGRSPRSLTRVALARRFATGGTGRSIGEQFHVDQLMLFPEERSAWLT